MALNNNTSIITPNNEKQNDAIFIRKEDAALVSAKIDCGCESTRNMCADSFNNNSSKKFSWPQEPGPKIAATQQNLELDQQRKDNCALSWSSSVGTPFKFNFIPLNFECHNDKNSQRPQTKDEKGSLIGL